MDKIMVKSIVMVELQKEESWYSAPFWSECAGSTRLLNVTCAPCLMPVVSDVDSKLKIRELLSLYESQWNWATCTSWGCDHWSDGGIIVISSSLIWINLEALYKENIRSLLKDKVTCLRLHSSVWSADLIHWTTFPSSVCIVTSDKWLRDYEGFLETLVILTM